jgi:hypothetical protein
MSNGGFEDPGAEQKAELMLKMRTVSANILEVDGGDVKVHPPPNCALENGLQGNFMLDTFHHDKKES